MVKNNMTTQNKRINNFVDPEGHNFATGNVMKLTIEPTNKDLKTKNPPTTLESLQMSKEKQAPLMNNKMIRHDKSVWTRHSGDQAIK